MSTSSCMRSRRAGQTALAMAIATATVIGGCVVTEPVYLHIDTAAPLACNDPAGVPLYRRALAPEHRARDVLLVFDFLRTIDRGTCSPTELVADCEALGCAALPEHRACLRVPRASFSDLPAESFDELLLSHFVEGTPQILADGPEGVVLPRITILLADDAAAPCPSDAPTGELLPFDPDLLLGCGYACPVTLEGSSRIDLDFDPVTAGAVCGFEVVQACANLGLAR
ncbi:MAG: hypothetical protein M3Y87_37430 [Myxococcota bacterium]|nr:hypothetical protein [Myxococcota bacterium]